MRKLFVSLTIFLAWFAEVHAQAPSYQNKTVKIIVGYLSGDTHDLWARAYARSMGKHLPGNPDFVVQNMPGAGTMIAANYVYNVAKPDGLTLGSIAPGLYLAQLIGNKEVKFDWPKFNWIGSPEQNGTLLFMRSDAPYKTLEDIRNAKEPPKCSATAIGTSGHLIPMLLEETLGLKFQLVTGYPGGAEQDLALERGEVHCRAITIAAFFARQPFINWHKSGFVRILIQTSRKRNPKVLDVPTLFELMEKQKVSDSNRRLANVALGSGGFGAWPIVSTPGLSADHTKLLRVAYAKTLEEPEFRAEAKKRGWELKPTTGEELATLAKEVTEQPSEVIARLKKLLGK
ncbi:MAG TPA: tripartite tricarboxylate transporter substrate-binding protein [Candidatus Binatia bacterium]|jgi:tripartite-type tricarboxylate transporter receptor subunit TctC